jgi:hypothetical protein
LVAALAAILLRFVGEDTTVCAQGGKGNSRLVAWEGDKTITFKMQDALISQKGFAILSGAGLVESASGKAINVHTTETVIAGETSLSLSDTPVEGASIYVVEMKDGEMVGSPIAGKATGNAVSADGGTLTKGTTYLVDYYVAKTAGVTEMTIEAGKFAGYYYVEASTLFRNEADGSDKAAEFVIPKAKVQSNFTFTMAPTGDPSVFDFTLDAFPDYTNFDKTKKVLAALQVVE